MAPGRCVSAWGHAFVLLTHATYTDTSISLPREDILRAREQTTPPERTTPRERAPQGRVRLRFWVSGLVLMAVLVLMAMGQWDFALAGIIGLVVANAGATLAHWD